jgi:hypothetical protein
MKTNEMQNANKGYYSIYQWYLYTERKTRLPGYVARTGDNKCIIISIGNHEEKGLMERSGRTWDDYIKMDVKDVECEVVDRIQVVQIMFYLRFDVSAVSGFCVL